MIFGHHLEWDTLTILKAITDHLDDLKTWKYTTSLGFSEDQKHSAFIIEASKEKYAMIIELQNEDKQIRIRAGIIGKYLPEGKREPKFAKIFPHTKIKEASQYFEEILEDLK